MVHNTLIKEVYEQGSTSEKYEIARNMLNKGIDRSTISECTGLSKEKIEELSKK